MTRDEFKLDLLLLGYNLVTDPTLNGIYIFKSKNISVPEELAWDTDMLCITSMKMIAITGMESYQIIIDTLIEWLEKK